MEDRVIILGCRGSVPVSGAAFGRYGRATSCVFVQLGGQAAVLDAGTGLLSLPAVLETGTQELPLLISHPHLDHIMGLPMCPAAMQPGFHFHVYAKNREGLGPEAQLQRLMAPPLWPVGPDALPAAFSFHTITGDFSLGGIQVACLEGAHPGGVTLFRLTHGETSLVYIPDCKLEGDMMEQAAEFARNCTLLLCDGQYAPQQWDACSGFGHSTWEMAAQLGRLCGAKMTRIFHHDPSHTDDQLAAAAAVAADICPNCTFAYEREVILL